MFKYIAPILMSIAIVPFAAFSSSFESDQIKVKITVGKTILTAFFDDNATSRALIEKFPMTIPMEDLYGREMCFRFSESLPANEASHSGYDVGDIVYWAPRHSFVIMYDQNGERISSLQKVGHIQSGVEVFKNTGDSDVTFELFK